VSKASDAEAQRISKGDLPPKQQKTSSGGKRGRGISKGRENHAEKVNAKTEEDPGGAIETTGKSF